MFVEDLKLDGVKLIHPQIFEDERGFFRESFHAKRYLEAGIKTPFVQDNHSFSKKGTVRGMHFQSEPGQAKLVSVIQGKIWDVVVDMRLESATFGQWVGVELDQTRQLFVPVGFAHGFCVLSDEAHVHYKVSHFYNPKTEKGFRFDDEEVGIEWPIDEMIVSERDQKSARFCEVVNR